LLEEGDEELRSQGGMLSEQLPPIDILVKSASDERGVDDFEAAKASRINRNQQSSTSDPQRVQQQSVRSHKIP
jgi:hypothetical protein